MHRGKTERKSEAEKERKGEKNLFARSCSFSPSLLSVNLCESSVPLW